MQRYSEAKITARIRKIRNYSGGDDRKIKSEVINRLSDEFGVDARLYSIGMSYGDMVNITFNNQTTSNLELITEEEARQFLN